MSKTKIDKLIDKMESIAGKSTNESRDAVIQAHGGIEALKEIAMLWAEHENVIAVVPGDIIIAYATAIDFGYRIAKRQELPDKQKEK